MFEELIRTALVPLISRMTALPTITGPVRDAVERFAETFIREIVATRRGDIIRLIVSEGPRFPAIADFYFREVVSKGLEAMSMLVQLAVTRGEIKQREIAQFPQPIVRRLGREFFLHDRHHSVVMHPATGVIRRFWIVQNRLQLQRLQHQSGMRLGQCRDRQRHDRRAAADGRSRRHHAHLRRGAHGRNHCQYRACHDPQLLRPAAPGAG